MADLFKSNFGDKLVKEPLPDCKLESDCYPSPEQLKRRIIIKHKKLEAGTNEVIMNSTKSEDDLCNSLHNGFLFLEDKIDGQWTKVCGARLTFERFLMNFVPDYCSRGT